MFTLMLALAWAEPSTDPAADEAAAASDEEARPWDRVGWGWGGVPAVNFNSDEGFGFGAVGSLYRYDGQVQPYKTGITLILFATTKSIQAHSLEVDMLRVGNTPLRLTVRGALDSTKVDNYCGHRSRGHV